MKKYILTILLVFWVVVILVLSFQDGEGTAGVSMLVTRRILSFLGKEEADYNTLLYWDQQLRLIAHPAIFFLYGILSMGTVMQYDKKPVARGIGTVLLGIILCAATEMGKYFIDGRHCSVKEMCLNVIGMCMAYAVVFLILWIKKIFGRWC